MADVTLSYKGSDILELSNSGSATLKTGGKYCEGDIAVEYVKPSGGGATAQNLIDKTWPSGEISITLPQYDNAVPGWLVKGYRAFGFAPITKCNVSVASGATLVQFPDYLFYYNTTMPSISLNDTDVELYVGATSFQYCTALKVISLPTATKLYTSAFANCSNLETVELGQADFLRTNVFSGDRKLTTLILRGTNVCSLSNTNNFNSTPFWTGGTGGTIYIPKTLYDHLGDGTALDYKAATNWSTIDGYGTITWAKIEGSYYETHYADGTVIS